MHKHELQPPSQRLVGWSEREEREGRERERHLDHQVSIIDS